MILLLSGTSKWESALQLISVLLIFVFVLAVTYFTTRWIGKYQQGQAYNRNIKVIETYKLTNNKFLQIIKAGESYLLIAICKDSVTMLTKLDPDEIDKISEEGIHNQDFHEILSGLKNMKLKKWTGSKDEKDNGKE